MNKKLKPIIISAAVVLAGLIALIIVLIVQNNSHTVAVNKAQALADSLEIANDQLLLTTEFNQLNADFNQYEGQQIYLKNDSIIHKYNEARLKVEGLLRELNEEKSKHSKDMAASRAKIKQLEGEIATLKGIVRHYLEEIKRLGEENTELKNEIKEVNQRNEQLATQVSETSSANRQLEQTVALAKKLTITSMSFSAYNKKGKVEKNVTKAKQLGASFTVSPNATAAPGMKTFYMRIISPEGTLLGNGGSFSYNGSTVQSSASRQAEYDNEELHVSIYWDVNTTLIPGDYTVEIFCDGNRLASRHFTMNK